LLRSHRLIFDIAPVLPLGHRLRVDPVLPGQGSHTRLTVLDCATNCRCCVGLQWSACPIVVVSPDDLSFTHSTLAPRT
jgi:hypothetical protein